MARHDNDLTDRVHDLIATCMAAERGYRWSAEQARRHDLRDLYINRADDSRIAASELRAWLPEGPRGFPPSAAGASPRGWSAQPASPSVQSDLSMLDDCRRCEAMALGEYRALLARELPAALRVVVERQHDSVTRHHRHLCDLGPAAQACRT
ncbi:MAG TPA: aldehyde dehydrogenase [Rubrivivax sp.]